MQDGRNTLSSVAPNTVFHEMETPVKGSGGEEEHRELSPLTPRPNYKGRMRRERRQSAEIYIRGRDHHPKGL